MMIPDRPSSEGTGRTNAVIQLFKRLGQTYQSLLDKSTPHPVSRWIFTFLLITIFIARVLYTKGWYIVTYALGIYHLNLFIAFLSPKIDPAMSDYEGIPNKLWCLTI